MMPLSQTTLEVTVVSGEEVRLRDGRALRGGAYAVVHTVSSATRTLVDDDRDCNGYPYWGEAMQVTVPASSTRRLDVEICRTTSGGRVESVASARIPAEDFHVGPPGHLHCLSYRLFDRSSGPVPRRNGIVNITVKRLDGERKVRVPQPGERKASVPATGKAVDAGATESAGSCCGVAEEGKPAASAAPAGVAMGYPVGVGFSAAGHAADDKRHGLCIE